MDPLARYDRISEMYHGIVGDDVSDPATASLLALAPETSGARVLDLACGQGRVSRDLARRGAIVVGIDVSERLLEVAREIEGSDPMGNLPAG